MKKKKKIFEGTSKKLYSTEDPELIIQEFKDVLATSNGEAKGAIKGKGACNNQISGHLFEYLEGFHISTHFVKNLSNKEMLVYQLEMLPVQIAIHNVAAGDLCTRFGLEEGQELDLPIIEMFLKKPDLKNPMINCGHAIAFGYTNSEEISMIERLSSKINAVLKSFFMRRGLKLVDFNLEFGRQKSKIILGDEISPETCRLWDIETDRKFGRDRMFAENEDPAIACDEILQRIFNN